MSSELPLERPELETADVVDDPLTYEAFDAIKDIPDSDSSDTDEDHSEPQTSNTEERETDSLALDDSGRSITLEDSSMEQIHAYINKHGNETMVQLARYLPTSCVPWGFSPFSAVESRFLSVFPYPRKVEYFWDFVTRDRVLAIAAVYLFFYQYHMFKKEKTTLIGLHNAIKFFFETRELSDLKAMLWNPEGGFILSVDLANYYDLWKSHE